MTLEKAEKAQSKLDNKKKLEQFDKVVQARDAAMAAAEAERQSKAKDIKKAVDAEKKKAKKYMVVASEMSKLLIHLGVAPVDVALLMKEKTDSEKLKLSYKSTNAGETSAVGEADAPAEAAEAEAAGADAPAEAEAAEEADEADNMIAD